MTNDSDAVAGQIVRGVRPCDLPCQKCGSDDVYRRFVATGQHIDNTDYGKPPSRYSRGRAHAYYATRDHLQHKCRCCGYVWETLPMPKPKKAKSVEKASA